MERLSKLFGSENKVKILRLFLLNPESLFDVGEIATRVKAMPVAVRKEVRNLSEIDFIRSKIVSAGEGRRKKKVGKWHLNPNFALSRQLGSILFNADIYRKEDILARLRYTGKLKLIIVAGIFTGCDDSRADLMVVGDGINKRAFNVAIKNMEAEIGRELNYGVFDTDDYKYRLSVFDKFVRDVLDYPHEKLLDKLGEIV